MWVFSFDTIVILCYFLYEPGEFAKKLKNKTMNKRELWLKLKNYHFDHLVPKSLLDQIIEKFGGVDASTKAFASKLSRKFGWEKSFALQAIIEYKKFIFLGVTSKTPISPSRIIDMVWHEHMLFTKAYRQFCNDVIEYQFDHNPELIPVHEQTIIFTAQYAETLELYELEFKVIPPAEIWGETKFKSDDTKELVQKSTEKKTKTVEPVPSSSDDSMPLWMYFDPSFTPQEEHHHSFEEFGGGSFSGGGAGGSFSDGDTPVADPGNSHSIIDSITTTASTISHSFSESVHSVVDSVSDGGGHSSCSSSCGGGGGD